MDPVQQPPTPYVTPPVLPVMPVVTSPVTPVELPPVPMTPAVPPITPSQGDTGAKDKKSSLLKWILLGLMLIFFIMGIGTFIFVAFNNATQHTQQAQTYNPPSRVIPSPTQAVSSTSAEQQLQDIDFGNPDSELESVETDLQQL